MDAQILQGDCMDILPTLPAGSVDLVVTSPPYDSLRQYGGEWLVDLPAVGREVFRVLKDGGVAVIVIQDQTKDFKKSVTSFRSIVSWCDAGLSLFECLIYQRDGRPGAWWNGRFRVDHEYMPVFFKGDRPAHFDKSHLGIRSKWAGHMFSGTDRLSSGKIRHIKPGPVSEIKCRGTLWKYTVGFRGDCAKHEHPATFPDQMPVDHILCWTQPGAVVLDPFCGSGTTGVACLKTNRRFIGIEKNPAYCDLSERRLATTERDIAGRLFHPAEVTA